MAIAGGTDVIPYLKGMFSPIIPDTVVNLKTIPNLDYIKEEGGMLKVGALAKLTAIANNAAVKAGLYRFSPGCQGCSCP